MVELIDTRDVYNKNNFQNGDSKLQSVNNNFSKVVGQV